MVTGGQQITHCQADTVSGKLPWAHRYRHVTPSSASNVGTKYKTLLNNHSLWSSKQLWKDVSLFSPIALLSHPCLSKGENREREKLCVICSSRLKQFACIEFAFRESCVKSSWMQRGEPSTLHSSSKPPGGRGIRRELWAASAWVIRYLRDVSGWYINKHHLSEVKLRITS